MDIQGFSQDKAIFLLYLTVILCNLECYLIFSLRVFTVCRAYAEGRPIQKMFGYACLYNDTHHVFIVRHKTNISGDKTNVIKHKCKKMRK